MERAGQSVPELRRLLKTLRRWEAEILLASLATVAVVLEVTLVENGAAARLLSARPLVVAGRMSYGLYLWHWPLFLTINGARTGLSGPPLLAVRLVTTAVLALVSLAVVELPVRTGGLPGWRAAASAAVSLAVVVGLVVIATRPEPAVTASAAAPPPPVTLAARGPGGPPLPARPVVSPRRILLLGDSVARSLGWGLPSSSPEHDLHIVKEGVLGCGVARGLPYRYFGSVEHEPDCAGWPDRFRALIERDDPDVVVLLVGRWEVMDRVRDGDWTHVGEAAYDEYLAGELDLAIDVLTARGARVALCTAPYYRRGERPDGGLWPEDEPWRVDRWNELVREAAARHPDRVVVVELGAQLAPEGRFTRVVNGVAVRNGDGVHFNPDGARWLAPWLLPQVAALTPR